MPEPDDSRISRRPFWSGTLAFGLVSVPVRLYPANRAGGPSLRMLAPDWTPLSRRYVCPAEGKAVEPEHIVRGYEVDGEWVVVTDEELEALQPEKSREIALERFVPVESLDPVRFQRAYYLVPAEEGARAYRLLAAAMERAGHAGIATFVMRGREYLTAILASGGVIRAETLRFADEIRSPEDVGLGELPEADAHLRNRFEEAMESIMTETLDPAELADPRAERLRALAERKREEGEDVVRTPESEDGDEAGADVIDLMELLRKRLESADGAEPGDARARGNGKASATDDLEERTRDELYERAKALDIPGRSSMRKDELIEAIRKA